MRDSEYEIRRHEFAHGEDRAMNPGRIDDYGPAAFRGFSTSPQQGRDYESNAGYRDNYNRLGEADARTNHRGKGPKDYRRNDERILEDINDRMCDNPDLDASDIEIAVNDGEVILTGTVESKNAKRLAEDIGEEVAGVTQVENRLKVRINGI
jgi:hypothetical protein